jgi:hypothetical protein
MPTQEIFLDFDADNQAVISVKGAKGRACKSLTADLERKLGTVTSTEDTDEMRQTEAKQVNKKYQK